MRRGRSLALAAFVAVLGGGAYARAQQDLGHKVLGTIGLDAGVQPEAGVYVSDRVAYYHADELMDRHGNPLPVGFQLDAFANGLGFSGVWKLHGIYFSHAVAVPVANVDTSIARPEGSLDKFGLGDLYVLPLRLGHKTAQTDAVASYGFYAPTSTLEPGGNGLVGRGQWSHEFSLGGTVYFDAKRRWRVSALASYDLFQKKRGVDITRGDSVRIQGGAGGRVFGMFDLGVAAYALWQVRDDRGSDLPPVLSGARDRGFGVGPELAVLVPKIRARVNVRYEHDLGSHARPEGGILVFGFTIAPWVAERP